jgi:hypothetical protein
MQSFRLFDLGLNQKHFGGNHKIANVSINLGCTKGRGSSTRMFNYCKERSANPSECINQFINVSSNVTPLNYHWSALGSGTTGDITSIALDSLNNVYAVGQFTNAGGVPANNIAKWNPNTSTWSALTSGLNDYVESIAIDSLNNVYVGGYFTSAGGVPVNYIAKWNPNTSTWSALGSGIVGAFGLDIYSIAIDSLNNVYVGGYFTSAGGVPVNNIAKWNPNTSTWSALTSGINYLTLSIAIDSADNVYVGGQFTTAGGVSAKNIAKWNPNTSTWSALGTGTNTGANINVKTVAIDSVNNVYIGGSFTSAGGVPANYIAKWNPNTSTWSALGNGLTTTDLFFGAFSIAIDSLNNVYAGGQFTTAGDVSANYIAKWNPNTSIWSALDNGLTGGGTYNRVSSIGIDSANNVNAAGAFTTAGTVPANNIAKWGV